jgi:DNA-binding transcriptional regulator YhcF (GntR family)
MNFKESKSIYLQIADRLCDEILQGRYGEEERMPSVREYAALMEVTTNTALRSFDYLQSQEVIYNKRGLGYFVAKGAKNNILSTRRATFLHEEVPEFIHQLRTLDVPIERIVELYNTTEINHSENEQEK